MRLAQLQHEAVDRLALQEAAEAAVADPATPPPQQLNTVAGHLPVRAAHWRTAPDTALTPALLHTQGKWGALRGKNAQNKWVND